MSITTTFYTTNYFKSLLLDGTLNLASDTFKIILLGVNSSNVSPKDIDPTVWKGALTYTGGTINISEYELPSSGTNYTVGGKVLTSVAVTTVTNSLALKQWDASDPTWSSLNVNGTYLGVTGFAIYDDTAAGDPLICVGIFSAPAKFTTQNYTIKFSSSGIMRI